MNIETTDMVPYRGRTVNLSKKVAVYRNLHKPGRTYSIRQNGLIVGHCTKLTMHDCSFVVFEAGRQRVITEKRKNVHAFVVGKISELGCMGTDAMGGDALPITVRYNPYQFGSFYSCTLKSDGKQTFHADVRHLKGAEGVLINEHGITAAYTY